MEGEKRHLRISSEKVRKEPVVKTGFGKGYPRENYREHGERLLNDFRTLTKSTAIRKDAENLDTLIVQVLTPDEEKAKAHSFKMKDLGMEIISYSNAHPNTAIVSLKKSDLVSLENKIERYAERESHPGKTNLSVIENIIEVPLYERLLIEETNKDVEINFVISIYTVFNRQQKEQVSSKIYSDLLEKGAGNLKLYRFSDGSFTISGSSTYEILKEIGQDYYSINTILPNRQFVTKKSAVGEALPSTLKINPPTSNIKVAVVDSGIDPNCKILEQFVEQRLDNTPVGTVDIDTSHGTLVASRIVFGDNITDASTTFTLTAACRLIDINIFGIDDEGYFIGQDETDLSFIIDSIVPQLLQDDVFIYNMSLGLDSPAQDGAYSILAKRLDYLSYKHKVLFILAAGNIDRELTVAPFPDYFLEPVSRIQPPADSILGLTVGSVAKFSDSTSLCRVNEVSSFSCIGPGVDTGIKPDIVTHGGNTNRSPRTAAYGLHSDGVNFAYDAGTSFSAPLATHYAVKILEGNPSISPILLKAYLIHFTEKRLSPSLGNLRNVEFVGHGEPIIEHCLEPRDNSVAYIFESDLDTDNYQIIPFHIPPCFASGTNQKLLLRFTLVYDPPIDMNNNAEYSQSKITVALFKNDSSGLKPINFSANDYKFSNHWNPVIKMEKTLSRNFASGEWEVKIRCYNRGNLPSDFRQSYAMIIEVIDPTSSLPVYNDIIKHWPEYIRKPGRAQASA